MHSQLIDQKPKFLRGFSDPETLRNWILETGHMPSLAFVGRSNVGKSSLINKLFGQKTAKTSKTPGRTREINLFEIEAKLPVAEGEEKKLLKGFIYDLPGYGHASVSKEMAKNWNYLMSEFFAALTPTCLLFNIQDSRHPFQKSDVQFLDFIAQFQLSAHLLLNKYDKLKKQSDRSKMNKIVKENLKDYAVLVARTKVSAETGIGLEEVDNVMRNHFQFVDEQ